MEQRPPSRLQGWPRKDVFRTLSSAVSTSQLETLSGGIRNEASTQGVLYPYVSVRTVIGSCCIFRYNTCWRGLTELLILIKGQCEGLYSEINGRMFLPRLFISVHILLTSRGRESRQAAKDNNAMNNFVHHYTSLDALTGIIGNDICLWASRYDHMNDPHEQIWAKDVVLKYCKNLPEAEE